MGGAALRAADAFAPLARRSTWALSASTRADSASTSFATGTPSRFSAFAVRSSKMLSSLSHC